jgi:hypothetical protein
MLQPGAHVAANCRVDEVDWHVAERPEHAVDPARYPACNMQHATRSVQHMHRAACNRAACSIRPTPSKGHGATCSAQYGPSAAAACSCVHSLSHAHAHTHARARTHTHTHRTARHRMRANSFIRPPLCLTCLPPCARRPQPLGARPMTSHPRRRALRSARDATKMTKPICNVPRCNIQRPDLRRGALLPQARHGRVRSFSAAAAVPDEHEQCNAHHATRRVKMQHRALQRNATRPRCAVVAIGQRSLKRAPCDNAHPGEWRERVWADGQAPLLTIPLKPVRCCTRSHLEGLAWTRTTCSRSSSSFSLRSCQRE